MPQPVQLLIIDNREKTGVILEEVFQAQGFAVTRIKEDGPYSNKPYDIIITEIKRNLEVIQEIKKQNPWVRVVFFYNVSRDEFIEKMYAQSIETLLARSFKVNDLLSVAQKLSKTQLRLKTLGLDLHLSTNHKPIEQQEFTGKTRRVADDVIVYVNTFLNNHEIHLRIRDLEIFDIAVMEVLDNVFQAQDKSAIKPYRLQVSCGFDDDKFVLSVGANTGNVDKLAVMGSIQRKMQFSIDEEHNPQDEYVEGKYFGSQGRGFYIIQKGVHRLSVVILDQEAASRLNLGIPWFETSIVLYFKKGSHDVANFQAGVGVACILDL